MTNELRPDPEIEEISDALEAVVGPEFARPEWAKSRSLREAKPLLTLDSIGGLPMPENSEMPGRIKALRELLQDLVPRLGRLSRSELEEEFGSVASPDEGDPYEAEAARLEDAANVIFQLHDEMFVPKRNKTYLYREAREVWKFDDDNEHPQSQWFKRSAQKRFLLRKLAEWIIEREKAYRKDHLASAPSSLGEGGEGGQPADGRDRAESRPLENEPPAIFEKSPLGEVDRGEVGVEEDANEQDSIEEAPTVRNRQRQRPVAVVVGGFVVALIAGALALAADTWRGAADSEKNPAGEITQTLQGAPLEDMDVAGDFVWLVNSGTGTATRISGADGKRETIFLEQPPQIAEPAPGTGSQVGGYRVVAGPDRAWIVTNGGVVLAVGKSDKKAKLLNPRIKVLAGEPALLRGALWIGGLGSYPLVRLRAHDGAFERKYAPRTGGSLPGVDGIAAGVGSIWARDFVNERRVYKITPEPGHLGVAESLLPLDRPADELAAGLGAVWAVSNDGTVTRYDPATGNPSDAIQISGGAQDIALSDDAVWIATGNDTAVRIDPTTLAVIGAPIKLPGTAYAMAADQSVWIATDRRLVEITPAS